MFASNLLFMKKLSLLLLASVITLMAFAQNSNDPTYGYGAVKTQNGKVVFVKDNIHYRTSDTEDVYNYILAWAKGRYVKPIVLSGKIRESESESITIKSTEPLTFKKTAIITDEAKISYTLTILFKDGTCELTFTDISYTYEEEREGGGGMSFTAEEWITDKESFNKSGTKMLKSTGKFRVKTIDLVSSITEDIQKAATISFEGVE